MKTKKHPASFIPFGAAVLTLSAALTACGGSSDSEPTKEGAITVQCPISTGGTHLLVTAQGCLGELGNQTHTMSCKRSSLHMLSGDNWTRQEVETQGSSINAAGGVTIQGRAIKCI
jgi:hypothetical protein